MCFSIIKAEGKTCIHMKWTSFFNDFFTLISLKRQLNIQYGNWCKLSPGTVLNTLFLHEKKNFVITKNKATVHVFCKHISNFKFNVIKLGTINRPYIDIKFFTKHSGYISGMKFQFHSWYIISISFIFWLNFQSKRVNFHE